MQYLLWDCDSSNLVGYFPSEQDALAAVAGQIKEFGRDEVRFWLLLESDETKGFEGIRQIAYDDELADRTLHPRTFVRKLHS